MNNELIIKSLCIWLFVQVVCTWAFIRAAKSLLTTAFENHMPPLLALLFLHWAFY